MTLSILFCATVDHTWDVVGQLMTIFPGKRYEHSAVVYNKAMWIVGGLEIFTPRNDVWKWEFGEFFAE